MARTSTKTSNSKKKTATSRDSTSSSAAKTAPKTVATAPADKKSGARRARLSIGSRLNPNRLLAELFGTFILVLVIIAALSGKFTLSFFATPAILNQAALTGQTIPAFTLMPWIAGFAFAALVFATYRISGGHLNPAVTLGNMALRRTNVIEGIGYVLAQVLGAMLALSVTTRLITVLDPATGSLAALDPGTLFNHSAAWNIFFAELLGAAIFGFGVAAAAAYGAGARAVLMGSSLILGAGVALMAGAGLLNPAVAVGVGVIGFGEGDLWALAGIYLGGATLGVIIGMALYALLGRELNSRQSVRVETNAR